MAYRRLNPAPIYDPPGSPSWVQWYNSLVFQVNANAAIDNNTSVNGDATGTNKNGVIEVSLSNTGITPGTYNTLTVDAKGRATVGTNHNYLTGNQTVTLTGDVTGSGSTSITVNVNPVALKTQQTPSTSTRTVTHSIPITCGDGNTYYLLASSTGP